MKKFFIAILALMFSVVIFWFVFPKQVFEILQAIQRANAGLSAQSLEVDGETWPYLIGGPEDAPTIVMIHGFGGNKDGWTQMSATLTDKYRVIAPDLPGFGEHAWHADKQYNIEAQLPRLHNFLKAANVQQFDLVGNSMGGTIAAAYAKTYPQQINTLILMSAYMLSAQSSDMQKAQAKGEQPLMFTTPEEFDRTMSYLFVKLPSVPDPIKGYLIERATAKHPQYQAIGQQLQAMGPTWLDDQLPGIRKPTLVLWGDQDRILHVSGAKTIKKHIPAAVVQIMPDMGHLPMREAPADTAKRVRQFLHDVHE